MKKTIFWIHIVFLVALIYPTQHGNAAFDPKIKWNSVTTENGLSSNTIYALTIFNNYLFIGTDKGLNSHHPETGKIEVFSKKQGLPHHIVRSLLSDNNQLWIGTNKGLAVLQNNRIQPISQKPLNHLSINTLAKKSETLYIGTKQGLWTYNLSTKKVSAVKHWKKKSIRSIKHVNQGLLITTHKSESGLFKPKASSTENFHIEFNDTENNITSIGELGDYIWFATDGNGLIGYNIMSYQWFSFKDALQVDPFANVISEDGQFLWYGSFSGLYRFDIPNESWHFMPQPRLEAQGVSSLAIDGNILWIGTPANGLVSMDKRFPHIEIQIPSRYYSNNHAVLIGKHKGLSPLNTTVQYRSLGEPDQWLTKHTRLKTNNHAFELSINFDAFEENIYDFRISTQDENKTKNQLRFTLAKEMHGVKLVPKPTTLKTGRTRLTGFYDNKAIERIIIQPGNYPAQLNPTNRTFSGEVELTLENKQIQLSMYKKKGKPNHVYYPIKVKPAPSFKVIPLATTFIPGLSEIPFHLEYDDTLKKIHSWIFTITDHKKNILMSRSGQNTLPKNLVWNGKDTSGKSVPDGSIYHYTFSFQDLDGLEIKTSPGMLHSSMVFHPSGKRLRDKIPVVILFGKGATTPLDLSDHTFQLIHNAFIKKPGSLLAIEGHTDNQPILSEQFISNQRLSEARAQTISNLLIKNTTITKTDCITIGYGASLPIADNRIESNRLKNRRVEIFLLH